MGRWMDRLLGRTPADPAQIASAQTAHDLADRQSEAIARNWDRVNAAANELEELTTDHLAQRFRTALGGRNED